MTSFPVVPLPAWPPGGVPPEALAADIRAWVESSALTALVAAFDGELPATGLADQLAYLEKFSEVWDSRAGGERFDARYRAYPPEIDDLIRSAAEALGLVGHRPPQLSAYDHVLVLGGGRVTGRARSLHAAELASTVTAGPVAGLGSLRVLPPGAPGAGLTEAEVMQLGLQEAFPPDGPVDERTGDGWWVRAFPAAGRTVRVVAAPSRRAGQRANTADTLHGWVDLVHRPAATETVLLITTDLYVPFQHADAIATLGLELRCGIETAGFDMRSSAYWPNGPARPGELLQETRSAIFSLHRLLRHAL